MRPEKVLMAQHGTMTWADAHDVLVEARRKHRSALSDQQIQETASQLWQMKSKEEIQELRNTRHKKREAEAIKREHERQQGRLEKEKWCCVIQDAFCCWCK
jgi:ribosomal protein L22